LRKSTIKLVLTRHEQAAGFMAATVGRLTGKAGCCLSTLGPGATNFTTAAAYAQLAGFPMMMITGQKPIRKSKQGSFQIVDIVECMRPMTKFTKQIVDGDLVPSLVREAVRVAEEERPGAVHLELPEDIAETHTDAQPFPVYPVRRSIAEEKAIDKAIEMITSASHPLLLIGAGANRKRTQKMLREFVEQIHMPFVTTQMGKGVVSEDHPMYLGCCALSSKDYVHLSIEKADLIINVGHDVVEKPPFLMNFGKPPLVIHINFYTAKVDNVYFPQLEVVGDIANSIWQLKERLKDQPRNWDTSFMRMVKKDMDEHMLHGVDDPRFPLVPQRIVADVRKEVPNDGIVCLDNGMYKIWFARCYKASEPNTLLLDNALATMGAGLPSAMAAAILHPEKKVVAVCGDGGFMMNSQELETCVRLNLNLTVLVVNDNAYGMIKWKQNLAGFDRFGLDLGNPDFVAYANSYGVKAYRVTSADEFSHILHECLYTNPEGPKLIEVPVDYAWANEILDKEIPRLFENRKAESEAESEISKALASASPVALS
jgi:acetolactate synthase-1/2/3 large subunit